ncbi:hypothetical protein ACJRO7_010835 [Eucalyptus globulus]|uniref:WRKY domain-containing protein n=1 Tax=Eucalyptus globulus TaxID=34317 RepID=A0ABD3LE47_EUCGL
MLPNSQLSPTTGTFSLVTFPADSSMVHSESTNDGDKGFSSGRTFSFKPDGRSSPLSGFSALQDQGIGIDKQGFLLEDPKMDIEFQTEIYQEAAEKNGAFNSSSDAEVLSEMNSDGAQEKESVPEEDTRIDNAEEGNQKGMYPSVGTVRTSEDGYNWRKYGQKQVKGSEFPRSYYKCTQPNCQVKKKVERSLDGQITEIIYKGTHNHPKPQPIRCGLLRSSFSLNEMSEMADGSGAANKVEGGSVWRNNQLGSKDDRLGPDWRPDGPEQTSSTSVLTELSGLLPTSQGKCAVAFESAQTPELSSTLASTDGDDEDGATQGSMSHGEDADDEEPESKRRKSENSLSESNLGSRAVREPRVVIQIESDIDILDDGYRWRKYGQKVVKGNPNPRSYYKCTSAGCSVRKHVERASDNLKYVITTYEGKHNHEVPAARNSNLPSGSGNLSPAAVGAQANMAIPRNSRTNKPEAQVQDLPLFDRKPELHNEFLRSSLLTNFGNDMKFGASPVFPFKFPPLQSAIPCGSFGLNPSQGAMHQAGPIASLVPDLPISLPYKFRPYPKVPVTGLFDDNHIGKPAGSLQSALSGQRLKQNDMRFLTPKQEQRDDHLYDPCLPVVGPTNASSASIYHHILGNYPS